MPQIKSSFSLKSRASNFTRDYFNNLQEMRGLNPGHIDEGHISYCKETGKHYVFNMNNSFNEETGYFRLLSTGSTNTDSVLTSIVFDTLEDMRDSDISKLGQIVYCRETKSNYYYAYDDKYTGDDQIYFDEETGYFRLLNDTESLTEMLNEIDEAVNQNKSDIEELISKVDSLDDISGDSISNLINEVREISEHLWPTILTVSGTSGIYRQGKIVQSAYISWDLKKKNEPVIPSKVIVNGVEILDQDALNDKKYELGNLESKNTSIYSSSITNSVNIEYNGSIKSNSLSIKFIYPKFCGWLEGSSDEIDDIIITKDNINEYIKSGELLLDTISQQISLGSVGNARWFYAYPKSLGEVKSIIDDNGFNQMNGVDLYEINITDSITQETIPYYVYIQSISSDLSNITINIK